MRIGIVGGTGEHGSGLALRWAKCGHTVAIGSRDAEKARARAAELSAQFGVTVAGADNATIAGDAEVIVLTVPYAAHAETLRSIRAAAAGKPFVDVTVPLRPPKVSRVQLPPGQAAALEAQALLGPETPVASALHHVSALHLADLSHPIRCDVLVVADDAGAKATAMGLVRDLGLRALDAGPLANAVALESLTPVLIHLNRAYKSRTAGVVFTNLPEPAPE
jgi:NADPH-dependent F420 reductase